MHVHSHALQISALTQHQPADLLAGLQTAKVIQHGVLQVGQRAVPFCMDARQFMQKLAEHSSSNSDPAGELAHQHKIGEGFDRKGHMVSFLLLLPLQHLMVCSHSACSQGTCPLSLLLVVKRVILSAVACLLPRSLTKIPHAVADCAVPLMQRPKSWHQLENDTLNFLAAPWQTGNMPPAASHKCKGQ